MSYPRPVSACFSARPRAAFSLIELLTVIAIVGVLVAVTVVVVGRVRRNAQEAACASNLRQITMSALLAAQDKKGIFPAADESRLAYSGVDTLEAQVRPYLGNPGNLNNQARSIFKCPGSTDTVISNIHYGVNTSVANGTGGKGRLLIRIEQPGKTIYLADRVEGASGFTGEASTLRGMRHGPDASAAYIAALKAERPTLGTNRGTKANVAFFDGSVRGMGPDLLTTPAAGSGGFSYWEGKVK